MDKQLLDDLRTRLESEQDRLKALITTAITTSSIEEPQIEYIESQFVEGANDEDLICNLERCKEEYTEVVSALKRMVAGTYGTCTRCADEITDQRLMAIPEAALCFECACQQPIDYTYSSGMPPLRPAERRMRA